MAATKKKTTRKKSTRKKAARKKATRAKGTRRKPVARRGAGKKKRTAARRTKSVSAMTTIELAAELARRQRRLPALQRQHAALLEKLEAIEAEMAEIGGGPGAAPRGRGAKARRMPAGGGKRYRNSSNLEEALVATLKGRTMSVTDVTKAVQANGYKTTAANFRTIVNATLLKSDKIKKVSRGQYTAK
ncbi:MAG: hypothetical protein H6813_04480 [Phycisphaeraceae bacterium]|nr:hypothetical protein [Phycisphaeraceae bacterium]MCB9847205.1 hypothetical protein [Phycisphaeraceae bacterium]